MRTAVKLALVLLVVAIVVAGLGVYALGGHLASMQTSSSTSTFCGC